MIGGSCFQFQLVIFVIEWYMVSYSKLIFPNVAHSSVEVLRFGACVSPTTEQRFCVLQVHIVSSALYFVMHYSMIYNLHWDSQL